MINQFGANPVKRKTNEIYSHWLADELTGNQSGIVITFSKQWAAGGSDLRYRSDCTYSNNTYTYVSIHTWNKSDLNNTFNPFTATGYFDIPPPRWPTFFAMLFPILKEGMGLSLLDEFEVQYHAIKK